MGERVTIGREPPMAREVPPAPLEYSRGGRAGDWWREASAWGHAGIEVTTKFSMRAWPHVRAWWRQVGFALGLGFTLAGLGHSLNRHTYGGEGVILMFIGGVLIGLCVRVPLSGQR